MLFSGVLVTAAVAVIGYYLREWRTLRGESGKAQLTAQGSKVDRSAVASGASVTQTIGDTHHHHYPKAAPSQPPATQAPIPTPKYVEPLPNVRYIGADVISLQTNSFGALVEGGSLQNAIAIRFSNEARQDRQNITARIKAVLIYRYANNEHDVDGLWIGEGRLAEFSPDSRRHKLLAGMIFNGAFNIVTGEKISHFRKDFYVPDYRMLQNLQSGTVSVQLTDVLRSRLLYEGEFQIGINPLRISPKTA